jgi:Arc/MetJ-type ribon-helix-helix transcriptional regulator
MTLQITLPKELEAYVAKKLATGRFENARDLIIAALEIQQSIDRQCRSVADGVRTDLDLAWQEVLDAPRHNGVEAVREIRQKLVQAQTK